jgi:hypothetical protein
VSESNAPALLAQERKISQLFIGPVADARNFDVATFASRSLGVTSTVTSANWIESFGSGAALDAACFSRVPESIKGCRPKASNGERRPAAFNGRPARATKVQD